MRNRQLFARLKQNGRDLRDLSGTFSAGLDRIPTISKPSTCFDDNWVALGSFEKRFYGFAMSTHITISSRLQVSASCVAQPAGRHGKHCTGRSSERIARPTRQAGTTPAAGRGQLRSPQPHDTKHKPGGQPTVRHGPGGGGGRTPCPQGSPGPSRRGRTLVGLGCWCGGHEKNKRSLALMSALSWLSVRSYWRHRLRSSATLSSSRVTFIGSLSHRL